jgi:hypothetical protein
MNAFKNLKNGPIKDEAIKQIQLAILIENKFYIKVSSISILLCINFSLIFFFFFAASSHGSPGEL